MPFGTETGGFGWKSVPFRSKTGSFRGKTVPFWTKTGSFGEKPVPFGTVSCPSGAIGILSIERAVWGANSRILPIRKGKSSAINFVYWKGHGRYVGKSALSLFKHGGTVRVNILWL